jgi:hypothetical protein
MIKMTTTSASSELSCNCHEHQLHSKGSRQTSPMAKS